MTIKKIILQSTKHLQDAGVNTAQLDTKILIKAVTGFSDIDLILKGEDELTTEQLETFKILLKRRARHEPIAYLLGEKEFWGLTFKVTPATLIPRPESELFIETTLERFSKDAALKILDLGTGSGCLILSLLHEFKEAQGVAVDCSLEALKVAEENAKRLGLQGRCEFRKSHWCEEVEGKFDLIISNPPYIRDDEVLMKDVGEYEPEQALFGGNNGLVAYKRLIPQLKRHSHPKTTFLCEIGAGQLPEIQVLLEMCGMRVVDVKKDLQDIHRLVVSLFLTNS